MSDSGRLENATRVSDRILVFVDSTRRRRDTPQGRLRSGDGARALVLESHEEGRRERRGQLRQRSRTSIPVSTLSPSHS